MEARDVALVPAIMFVVWVFTKVGLPRRWAPLLALVLGVAGGLAVTPENYSQGILDGVIAAASAIGFNSGVRNTADALRKAA
ncbi:MAG: hypothetical protein IRZ11_06505 [Clostridia bacterium]|nr:hypothetical protein [Clostridia bacterium]